MLKTYTSHYKVWKSGFAHFILLSFLSRKHSSLKHWFWAEKNWRCVISVYQPSKSSLNFAVIPQKNRRSFLSDVCNLAWIEAVTEMIRHQLFFFGHLNTVTIVLMSSMSASDRFIVSLSRLNSLDCSTAGFSPVGWLALLHLFSLAC